MSTSACPTVAPRASSARPSSSRTPLSAPSRPTSYPSTAKRRATAPLTPGPAPTTMITGLVMGRFYRRGRSARGLVALLGDPVARRRVRALGALLHLAGLGFRLTGHGVAGADRVGLA